MAMQQQRQQQQHSMRSGATAVVPARAISNHSRGCGIPCTRPAAAVQLPPQQQMLMPLLRLPPTAVCSSKSSSRSSSHRAAVGEVLLHLQQLQDTVNLHRWYMLSCLCMVQC
jgi:hypothetical protein